MIFLYLHILLDLHIQLKIAILEILKTKKDDISNLSSFFFY